MTSHRAAYLRRAIPRLSEQYKPKPPMYDEFVKFAEAAGRAFDPWQRQVLADLGPFARRG